MSEDYTKFQAAADAGAAWAGPLSRRERATLAHKLARACGAFYQARTVHRDGDMIISSTMASAEMSELHMDVTERAAVATA